MRLEHRWNRSALESMTRVGRNTTAIQPTSTGPTKVDSARDIVLVRSKIRNNSAITPKRGLKLYRLNSAKNTTTIRPVTDTIHFLSRYQEERRHPQSIDEAIERAFQGVGTGMVMTTAVLVAGFASVTFSESRDYRVFGSLGVITLLTALICDLFLLPGLLKQFDRRSTESKTPNISS